MIYQCYFQQNQRERLFQQDPYMGFGLEPEVNLTVTMNCPELSGRSGRMAMVEYGCFLHIWRNIDSYNDDWFGFTSYRQLEKTSFMFRSSAEVSAVLDGCDIAGWGWMDLNKTNQISDYLASTLKGPAFQAEYYHPGMMIFLESLFCGQGQRLPQEFYSAEKALYANYWVMRRELFLDFMAWSWPIIKVGLAADHSYKYQVSTDGNNTEKAMGYVIERLFIIWYMMRNLDLKDLSSGEFNPARRSA
ncbi:MAG: hypothetical protein V7744_19970 [Pseudomonadales bacterium]